VPNHPIANVPRRAEVTPSSAITTQQQNVWVKNVLDSIGKYVSTLVKDNIDDTAPECCAFARFKCMCHEFDKEFSLFANYPKGWCSLYCEWMKEHHIGELLFYVERACKGRMNVVSMALMDIYWNRNYCVDFLDKLISYCGPEDNILARTQMTLLSSIDMVAVARLWSILHVAILMPMRWLAGKTLKLLHRKWGYISMGKVLGKLNIDLESIVDLPELIHNRA
jgi:hypothetical protein